MAVAVSTCVALFASFAAVPAVVFGAVVLGAVIMAFMDAMFVSKLNMFSCHFFLLPHLPCPGPGMLSVETEGGRGKLVDWCWVLGSV